LAAESHTAAIDRIEAIVRNERIDCDFERVVGYLLFPEETAFDPIDELEAAHRAGLTDVRFTKWAPLDWIDSRCCLRFPRQGQFHPLKYLAGLAKGIQRIGGQIFSSSHVEEVEGGTPARVRIRGKRQLTADHVIVATNSPINDRFTMHTKQAPYLSYVIGVPMPKVSAPRMLLWDTLDPYHYVRVQPASEGEDEDMLIVGGEDHKTGQADDQEERFERLAKWTRERFPMVGKIKYRWSGQVMETIDGLAFIGVNPMDEPNVYIATGDSGMGLTHGTIAGILLTDLILGRPNPWQKLYAPNRKSPRAVGTFAKENLNVLGQYGDWLTAGDVASTDAIGRGSGGILRRGMSKVAVYRDDDGTLHQYSAACPHLGCVVAWNAFAGTFDCPCHGSRFSSSGKVITGPANSDLTPVAKKSAHEN
jgi:glycine/D-amino acid oxidase-like deaminating enzyme/nitrite reductase/ring-hydroxylating ferredoxin subunit